MDLLIWWLFKKLFENQKNFDKGNRMKKFFGLNFNFYCIYFILVLVFLIGIIDFSRNIVVMALKKTTN